MPIGDRHLCLPYASYASELLALWKINDWLKIGGQIIRERTNKKEN
jgi:hypothetical protein